VKVKVSKLKTQKLKKIFFYCEIYKRTQ